MGLGMPPAAMLGLGALSMLTESVYAAAARIPKALRCMAVLSVLTGAWVLLHFVATGGAVLSGHGLLCGALCLALPVTLYA